MWRDAKRILFIFALGLGTGGYLAYEYQEGILKYADRGFCAQHDVAGTRWWANCMDAAVALDLQARQAARDADTDTILSSMALNQPKKGKRK